MDKGTPTQSMTLKPKTVKQRKSKKPSLTATNGQLVQLLIDRTQESLISRYWSVFQSNDLPSFASNITHSTLRWMERMINGPGQFTLETMDSWVFDETKMELKLRNPNKSLRDWERVYCVEFTKGNLDDYHIGMGLILSSFWYKLDATPPCVVELIACCDLLFRRYHNQISPAASAGISHTDIDTRSTEE